jgi:tape measure domain-containing protein
VSASGNLLITLGLDDGNFTVVARRAGQVINSFTQSVNNSSRAIEAHEERHASLARRFRNIMITIAATRFALMDFDQVVLGLPKAVIKASGEIERLTMLMKGLSKEVDETKKDAEARSNVDFVTKMAQNAPFSIKTIADAFVKLKSSGIDPTNGSLKGLLDSVAKFGGTDDILHRAAIAIQQMGGKGVISMEELRQQLGEAIPNAAQLMADGLGMSMASMIKMIGKGQLEAKSGLERMFFQMTVQNGGAAAMMMKTWEGMLNQLKTKWMLFEKTIGDNGAFQAVKDQLQRLLDGFGDAEMQRLAQSLGGAFKSTIDVLVRVIETIRNYWGEIKVLAGALATIWATNSFIAFVRSTVAGVANIVGALASFKANAIANQTDIDKKYLASALTHQNLTMQAVAAKQAAARLEQQADAGRYATGRFMSAAMIALYREEAAARMAVAAAATRQAFVVAAAANVMRVASTAMNLLLGPLGWIMTALSLAALAWERFGDSGAEAIERINDAAKKGLSSQADLAALQAQIVEKESAMQKEENTPRGDVNAKAARIAQMKSEIFELRQSMAKVVENLNRDQDREQVEGIRRMGERKLHEEEALANQEVGLLKKSLEEKKLVGDAYNAAFTQGQKEIWAKHLTAHKQFLEMIIKAEQTAMAANKDPKGQEGLRGSARLAELKRQLDQVTSLMEQANQIGDFKKMASKDGVENSAQRILRNLREEAAKLNAELDHKGAGDIAKLLEHLKDDPKLQKDMKDSGITRQQIIDAAAQTEGLKDQIKVRDDLNRMTERANQDIAGLTAEMEGESSASAKLEAHLSELWQNTAQWTPALFDAAVALEVLLEKLKKLDAQKNDKRITALENEFKIDTETLRASLGTQEEMLRAAAAKDIEHRRKKLDLAKADTAEHTRLVEEFNQYVLARTEVLSRELEGPMDKLARQWTDVTANMKQAQADWAQDFIDRLADGNMKWGDFVVNILKGILKIQLQASMAGPMNTIMSTLGNAVLGYFSGGTSGGMTGNGTLGSTGTPYGAGAGFANGGIMTDLGPVPLRKYAYGGVARSPQAAIFGEGSSPEAYVPLPDGRSIPVTMKNNAPNVIVNVINQSGQQVDAQQGQPRFDGRQMILDIVLSAANKPGGFRDGMKGALK